MNNKEIDNYIKNNMSLFYSMTYKIKNNLPSFAEGHEFDDILQCILEASVKYLRKYNIKKGSGIANYLNKTAYFQASRVLKNSFSLIRRPEYLICNATSFAKMSRLYNYSSKEIANKLNIPQSRVDNILSLLNGAYEPLNETLIDTYKNNIEDTLRDEAIDFGRINDYIIKRIKSWNERDLDILNELILKNGNETIKSLGSKYNVSHNCIYLRKKAIIRKLQKMLLKYKPNIQEELLNA